MKTFLKTKIVLIFLITLFLGCEFFLQSPMVAEPVLAPEAGTEAPVPPKTFTLTIDSKDVVIKLPNTLPSMATTEYIYEECFDLTVCRTRYCLLGGVLSHELHDHVDFIYTNKAKIIAMVWIRTVEQIYVAWKYVDSLPVLSSINAIIKLIKDAEKLEESSFIFESQSIPFFVDFTFEGELDPDEFTEWKLVKPPQVDPRGYLWIFWQNPNPKSPIKVVMGNVYIDETLVMYRYFKYGVPYMYYLDSEKNKYVQYTFTDEEKEGCMKCHSDQVKEHEHLETI